jgi:hypothetical protein
MTTTSIVSLTNYIGKSNIQIPSDKTTQCNKIYRRVIIGQLIIYIKTKSTQFLDL